MSLSYSQRTKAERSMDRWNESLRRLRSIENPTPLERRELRQVERRAIAARRAVNQMREGTR